MLTGIGERELLLVLDSFEHLLDAAPIVANILAACAGLKLLVTSREALHLRGEQVRPIDPLPLPSLTRLPSSDRLIRYDAIALFLQTLTAARPEFRLTDENAAAIAELCVRLEALPLAIELAASRGRDLSPQQLLAGLANRLELLRDGPRDLPARQRTLRDTIAWSHDLLDPGEQAVFRRLAVFTGGSSLEAALAVVELEGAPQDRNPVPPRASTRLVALAEKHLIRWERSDEDPPGARITMLDTVRDFAEERYKHPVNSIAPGSSPRGLP